jgi:hypothetical protein
MLLVSMSTFTSEIPCYYKASNIIEKQKGDFLDTLDNYKVANNTEIANEIESFLNSNDVMACRVTIGLVSIFKNGWGILGPTQSFTMNNTVSLNCAVNNHTSDKTIKYSKEYKFVIYEGNVSDDESKNTNLISRIKKAMADKGKIILQENIEHEINSNNTQWIDSFFFIKD